MSSFTIYLSSTYKDLSEERGAIIIALRKSGFAVTSMETYPDAFTDDVRVKCETDVKNCDIYICIIGDRYGSYARNTDGNFLEYSYTEHEFNTATKYQKRWFVFFKDVTVTDNDLKKFILKIDSYPKPKPRFQTIEQLNLSLISSLTAELLISQKSEKDMVHPSARYTCNRNEQVIGFNSKLYQLNHPFFFFLLHGNANNGHRMFVERC